MNVKCELVPKYYIFFLVLGLNKQLRPFHGITEIVSVTVVVSVNVVVDVVTDCIELSNHTVEVQPAPRSSTAAAENSDAYLVSGETLS